ncbi:Ig-like domain-containing protein [Aliivibrio salmonicida]|uniref:Ig-like domain-containing protein n=1 Tax=Aliivibrio salmonicida TaxID=40269 RepID=UPI0013EC5F05|nr:Ig-like domain-containing protein [Aliivibrio salmonicida]
MNYFSKALPFCFMAVSLNAMSGVEGVSYTDTLGAVKQSELNANNSVINNTSSVKLYISSGLDRRLRISLSYNGALLSTTLTPVINTNDRLSFNGKEFYGQEVELIEFQQEGDYTLLVETLDLKSAVVGQESYSIQKDVTGPLILDKDISWIRDGHSFGSIEVFSRKDSTKELRLNSLSDPLSGLSHVNYWIKHPNKDVIYKPANVNTTAGTAYISGNSAAGLDVAPDSNLYNIGFDVYDLAGNKSSISRNSHIDNICPKAPVVEVLNDKSKLWEPYKAKMLIFKNPVTVRWVRDVSDFEKSPTAPYGWINGNSETSREGSKSYYQRTFNTPEEYSYFGFFTKAGGYCYRGTLRNYNFTLGEGVEPTPKYSSVMFKTDLPIHDGKWINSTTPRYNKPYSVTDVRVNVAKRDYRQKVWGTSIPACFVEIGQTYCDTTTTIAYTSGRGYSPKPIYLSKDDGTLQLHATYLYTYWDMNPPVINDLMYEGAMRQIVVSSYDPDTVSDWRSGMWVISSVVAVARNVANKSTITLNRKKTLQIDRNNRQDSFDTSKLSDGDYEITVTTTDNYGNAVTKSISTSIDNTAPELKVTYNGGELPNIIEDIRLIELKVTDMSESELVTARLSGSSSNENVYLGILKQEDGNYTVEQPKIFPTLNFEVGERYELELVYKDDHGNEAKTIIRFGYTPSNLVEMDVQEYLTLDVNLKTRTDKPLATIHSDSSLEIDGGMVASGLQNAYLTNRSNSDFSVRFGIGEQLIEVSPGETKETQIDLGESGGLLEVDVFPAVSGVEGTASVMLDIPQLTSKWN